MRKNYAILAFLALMVTTTMTTFAGTPAPQWEFSLDKFYSTSGLNTLVKKATLTSATADIISFESGAVNEASVTLKISEIKNGNGSNTTFTNAVQSLSGTIHGAIDTKAITVYNNIKAGTQSGKTITDNSGAIILSNLKTLLHNRANTKIKNTVIPKLRNASTQAWLKSAMAAVSEDNKADWQALNNTAGNNYKVFLTGAYAVPKSSTLLTISGANATYQEGVKLLYKNVANYMNTGKLKIGNEPAIIMTSSNAKETINGKLANLINARETTIKAAIIAANPGKDENTIFSSKNSTYSLKNFLDERKRLAHQYHDARFNQAFLVPTY